MNIFRHTTWLIITLIFWQCINVVQATPRYFGAEKASLNTTKHKIKSKDTAVYSAYLALIDEANDALKAKPPTVTDKTSTAISGDVHDYYSTAPYLWPDPTKPDGLPYVPRDGKINPEARNPLHTDQMRMAEFGHLVETLALAYYFSDDEKYAEKAAECLRVWFLNSDTKMNPNMNYGQAVPGLTPGRAIGIIEGGAIIFAADAAALLESYQGWTQAEQAALNKWLNNYLEWLLTSEHGRYESEMKQNHGSMYDARVARLALILGKIDLARTIIENVKHKRILLQIEPDGAQPMELRRTKGFNYSLLNLEGLAELAELGKWLNIDLWQYQTTDGRGILKAIEFLMPYVQQPQPGIAPAVWHYEQIVPIKRERAVPLFRKAANALQSQEYEAVASQFQQMQSNKLQLLYPAKVH
jgi:hypothetical protein